MLTFSSTKPQPNAQRTFSSNSSASGSPSPALAAGSTAPWPPQRGAAAVQTPFLPQHPARSSTAATGKEKGGACGQPAAALQARVQTGALRSILTGFPRCNHTVSRASLCFPSEQTVCKEMVPKPPCLTSPHVPGSGPSPRAAAALPGLLLCSRRFQGRLLCRG